MQLPTSLAVEQRAEEKVVFPTGQVPRVTVAGQSKISVHEASRTHEPSKRITACPPVEPPAAFDEPPFAPPAPAPPPSVGSVASPQATRNDVEPTTTVSLSSLNMCPPRYLSHASLPVSSPLAARAIGNEA